jgi:hypothetical protein
VRATERHVVQPPGTSLVNSAGIFAPGWPTRTFSSSSTGSSANHRAAARSPQKRPASENCAGTDGGAGSVPALMHLSHWARGHE